MPARWPHGASASPWGAFPTGPRSSPLRRLQRAPARSAAIARRRHLAASGPMPPGLAAHFTTAELAVLRIVGDVVRGRGCCDRSIAEMAARAGCERTTVQNALREAARLGLVTVAERRRDGRKNDTNIIRVVSREWLAWLARGRSRPSSIGVEPIGFKMANPTDKEFKSEPTKQRNRAWAAKGQRPEASRSIRQ